MNKRSDVKEVRSYVNCQKQNMRSAQSIKSAKPLVHWILTPKILLNETMLKIGNEIYEKKNVNLNISCRDDCFYATYFDAYHLRRRSGL